MNKILLLLLCLYTPLLFGQSNISTNRIIIKDSLSLDGKWIKRINNDSTLRNAGEQSVSTDAAMKKYVDKVAAGGGMSQEELIEASLNPHYLEIHLDNAYKMAVDSSDRIALHFESSDGIRTSYEISEDSAWALFYVYGKPPFSLRTEIKNRTVDSILNIGVNANNKLQGYFSYDTYCMPGDTMQLNLFDLRGAVSFSQYAFKRPSSQEFFLINGSLKNHSSRHVLDFNSGYPNGRFIYPGKVETDQYYFPINYYSFHFHALNLVTTKYGDRILYGSCDSNLRLKVYKNGVLVWNEIIPAFSNDIPEIPLDSSWKEFEIILEDV